MSSLSSLPQATQRCHNCRRRRWRCDRSVPGCLKCDATGQQCLGYGKLFIWTDAVATRGKKAGKRSFGPAHDAGEKGPRAPEDGPSSPEFSFGSASPSATCTSIGSSPRTTAIVHSRMSSCEPLGASRQHDDFDSQDQLAFLHFLVDPALQDFDLTSRYYLDYYVKRVAPDLVVYDIPDRNPFRHIVALCHRHPFLQHVMVATGAVHLVSSLRSRGLPLQKSLYDALAAKQRTLRDLQLAMSGDNLGAHNYGDVLTAVVFLINFDLIDTGRDSWKAHVGAAGRLITLLQNSSSAAAAQGVPVDESINSLRDYIMSDCLTYFILSSTLGAWDEGADGGGGSQVVAEVFGSLDVISMLARAESNTYHSCPAEILTAILRSSQLAAQKHESTSSNSTDSEFYRLEAAVATMMQLEAFDAHVWAQDISAFAQSLDDPRSREHMASAHRSAARAFLLMAVPEAFPSLDPAASREDFAGDIFEHLRHIQDTEPLFKGTVWQTFVLGALTADPAKQKWVQQRLSRMWLTICPWGYVRTALETLEALWRSRDAEAPGPLGLLANGAELSAPRPSRSWDFRRELQALGVNCLIV